MLHQIDGTACRSRFNGVAAARRGNPWAGPSRTRPTSIYRNCPMRRLAIRRKKEVEVWGLA
eukprot:scaffold164234_cov27-Tisochrysis_lutea.AAC.2